MSFAGNKISICFIIDQIISIAERSGEFGGYLGIYLSLYFGPCSHVGINLFLKSALMIFLDNLEEWERAPSCWKNFDSNIFKSSL